MKIDFTYPFYEKLGYLIISEKNWFLNGLKLQGKDAKITRHSAQAAINIQ